VTARIIERLKYRISSKSSCIDFLRRHMTPIPTQVGHLLQSEAEKKKKINNIFIANEEYYDFEKQNLLYLYIY